MLMDASTRERIAGSLEALADRESWNLSVWQECYELVKANLENDLIGYLYDDLIHNSGPSISGTSSAFVSSPIAMNGRSTTKNSAGSDRAEIWNGSHGSEAEVWMVISRPSQISS
jgi:hypothetical protein